jgi:DNA repair photolyase
LATSVMFGPLLPGISDTDAALAKLFALAAEVNVDRVWTDLLNPRPRVWASVQDVIRRHQPDLHEHYRGLLFDAVYRDAYRRDLEQRIRRAAARAGVTDRLA